MVAGTDGFIESYLTDMLVAHKRTMVGTDSFVHGHVRVRRLLAAGDGGCVLRKWR